MATIGDLCEISGEVTTEWKIKNFSLLSQEIDKVYYSPKFYFSGFSWRIQLHPNGNTKHKSGGSLGLYLQRVSTGSPLTLDCSFSIKTRNGKRDADCRCTLTFDRKDIAHGFPKCISRLDLKKKEIGLIPSNVLTIICTQKTNETTDVAGSLFSRYDELIGTVHRIYKEAKKTDAVLKVSGQTIPAHRIILGERSPVFAAMFNHDTEENQTGEISIEGIEKSTMEVILEYLYSGDIGDLSTEKVLSVYSAADKYDIKQVKQMCSGFVQKNLSEDWIYDVIKFGELYEDEGINLAVKEFFKKNAHEILKTEKWKTFAKENIDVILKVYDTVILSMVPEKM